MAREAFDQLAPQYDAGFSHTALGKLHRERVWEILSQQKWLQSPRNILEINCGTGEDAMEWAKRGHQVLATDISQEMVSISRAKAGDSFPNLSFQQMSFSEIRSPGSNTLFDLVFSNFGGLNCISPAEVQALFHQVHEVLKPGGHLALVIMPDFCLWEMLIFILRGEWKNAFRRFQHPAQANILGATFPVFYYPPEKIIRWAEPNFHMKKLFPIGFFLPPSGRNHFFSRFPDILQQLNFWEKRAERVPFLSRFSDHYLIILEKTP